MKPAYRYTINPKDKHTQINLQMASRPFHTAGIPQTAAILQEHLPRIFQAECFNSRNLPFAKELKKTELGHLYEHILLEYLCMDKVKKGFPEATYSGVTTWDWMRNPPGSFQIYINESMKTPWFNSALKKCNLVFDKIISTATE